MSELSETLLFISDPGHGWLRVPISEIEVLGIAAEISVCSFVNGRFAFLEEDMDAGTYLNARREQGHSDPEITDEYVPYFDRSQRSFQPPAPPAVVKQPTAEEIEADLRQLWTQQGVGPDRQTELLADVERMATIGQLAMLFPERP